MNWTKFLVLALMLGSVAAALWGWHLAAQLNKKRRWTDYYIGLEPLPAETGKPREKRGRVWDEQERLIYRDQRERKKLRIVQ